MDHAIAWIVHLGKDIVSLKNECDQELLQLMRDKTSRKDHYAKSVNLKISDSLYKRLKDTNIKIVRYNNNPTNYTHAQIRENLSLEEAAECLVAAAFILIGTFSCKRKTEILNLTRNCCRPALDGGWELVFGLRKASPDEKLSLIGRPIPEIVNTAIDILRDLAPSNVIYNHENTEQAPLFLSDYKITKQPKIAVQRSAPSIYKAIELFADIVQVTPNEAGQRWYVRSHELRRFFAISYFWHSKFTNLSALSWFMGHGDIEQTLHYVTEEIANTEMPEEEARYVANLIMEEKDIPSSDIDDLKEKIKKYFGTDNINILNQEDIEDYLLEQFKAGIRVVKHSYNTTTIYTEEHYDQQESHLNHSLQ